MSASGLLDSKIAVCRAPATADNMGDIGSAEWLFDMKGSLANSRRLATKDEGAGEQAEGYMILYYMKKNDVRIGDAIYVRRGPMAGTWWTITLPVGTNRAVHREVMVKTYVGKQPVLPD
jgi:hypothetical protein